MKAGSRVLMWSILAGVGIWCIDATFDYLFFPVGTFGELLIWRIPGHMLYARLILVTLCLAFGWGCRTLVNRLEQHKDRLARAHEALHQAQAEERRRLAAQLHDQVSQGLALSMMKLTTLQNSAAVEPIRQNLHEVATLLDDVVQRTRSLTFDLSSPLLHRHGLEKAVAEWARAEVQEKHGVRTHIEHDGPAAPLSPELREVLYQSIRELLINVVKHAHAQNVSISFRRCNDRFEATVTDDGVGMDAARAGDFDRTGGFGLFSMQERLDQLGGRLEIDGAPGRGTRVVLAAPLTAATSPPREQHYDQRQNCTGRRPPAHARGAAEPARCARGL